MDWLKANQDIVNKEGKYFKDLKGLDPIFVDALFNLGYKMPTPVQY